MSLDPSAGEMWDRGRPMLANLSPLDWVLLGIAGWSVVRGFLRGAIREMFALLASVVALVTAYWEYRPGARWLTRWIGSPPERDVVAFLLVAAAAFTLVVLAGRLLRRVAHLVGLGPLDRLAGAVLGLARAAVVCTLLLSAIAAFLPAIPWVAESQLAAPLARAATRLAAAAPPELERRIAVGVGNLVRLENALR